MHQIYSWIFRACLSDGTIGLKTIFLNTSDKEIEVIDAEASLYFGTVA